MSGVRSTVKKRLSSTVMGKVPAAVIPWRIFWVTGSSRRCSRTVIMYTCIGGQTVQYGTPVLPGSCARQVRVCIRAGRWPEYETDVGIYRVVVWAGRQLSPVRLFRRGDNLAAKLPADKGCHQSHTQFPECADLWGASSSGDLMEKAVNYLKSFWNQIFAYLKDGRNSINNTITERFIRPLAVTGWWMCRPPIILWYPPARPTVYPPRLIWRDFSVRWSKDAGIMRICCRWPSESILTNFKNQARFLKTLRGKLPKAAFPMGYVKIGRLHFLTGGSIGFSIWFTCFVSLPKAYPSHWTVLLKALIGTSGCPFVRSIDIKISHLHIAKQFMNCVELNYHSIVNKTEGGRPIYKIIKLCYT